MRKRPSSFSEKPLHVTQSALNLFLRNTFIWALVRVLYTKIAVGLWQSSLGLEQLGQGQCCATQCPRAEKPLASESHKTFDGSMETKYWSSGYQGTSNFSALLTPLTFLITYFNSGINPLLYAFLSKNFRKGMKELLFCNIHGKRKSDNLILLNRVGGVGLRRSSTRSTRANCSTVTMAPNGES
ncbi:unnamed protein product [Danaus chrysippus]|uniref:(African queen) hypothetical protein n=1 Tax=Danaus chrysippus TaxID=151541 RepID=A0A8J2QQU2_9NEOP|nr:unnamed protein product [Danaus chrysippus]